MYKFVRITDELLFGCNLYPGNKAKFTLTTFPTFQKDSTTILLNAWGRNDIGYEIRKEIPNNKPMTFRKEYDKLLRLYNRIPIKIKGRWIIKHGFKPF